MIMAMTMMIYHIRSRPCWLRAISDLIRRADLADGFEWLTYATFVQSGAPLHDRRCEFCYTNWMREFAVALAVMAYARNSTTCTNLRTPNPGGHGDAVGHGRARLEILGSASRPMRSRASVSRQASARNIDRHGRGAARRRGADARFQPHDRARLLSIVPAGSALLLARRRGRCGGPGRRSRLQPAHHHGHDQRRRAQPDGDSAASCSRSAGSRRRANCAGESALSASEPAAIAATRQAETGAIVSQVSRASA